MIDIHYTHALSSNYSSSNDHSYNFENSRIKGRNTNKKEIKNENITIFQINKINKILCKYNLIKEKIKKGEKNINNTSRMNNNKQRKSKIINEVNSVKKKKMSIINNDINDKSTNKSNNNINNENNSIITANLNNLKKIKNINFINKKDRDNFSLKEEFFSDDNNNIYPSSKEKQKLLSYKYINEEMHSKRVKNYLMEEIKTNDILKNLKKNKLLFYQKNFSSKKLLRQIIKSEISFITKTYKKVEKDIDFNDKIFSGIKLFVINNKYFCTKQLIKNNVLLENDLNLKKEKDDKLKNEVKNEEEKIPTFSSINTSSSDSDNKLKPKKGKKSEKKANKAKKKHNKAKRVSLLPKSRRSISINSKIINEKNDNNNKERLSRTKIKAPTLKSSIKNISYFQNDVNNNAIKKRYSIASFFHHKFLNKTKLEDKNISNRTIIRNTNYNNNDKYKSPFKNNLLNINKLTKEYNNENDKFNSAKKDKDKENTELTFKKYLEQQRIKKHNQIRNFIKKKGINSYNFFYPKEPSPLLSVFKNKYNEYKDINKTNYNIKEKIRKMHLIERHHGNENDCPKCNDFKFKKIKKKLIGKINNNNEKNKIIKYDRLKFLDKNLAPLSPRTNRNIFNRINSARGYDFNNYNNNEDSSRIRNEYNVLYDYFLL